MNSEWVTNLEELGIWQDETFALLLHLSHVRHFVTLFLDRRQGKTTLLLKLAAHFKQHGKTIRILTLSKRTLERFQMFISPKQKSYDVCLIDDVDFCLNLNDINMATFTVTTTSNPNFALGTVIRIPFFE
jgi:hypothetical protein